MKRFSIAAVSAIALVAAVPLVSHIPGLAALSNIGDAIAQTANQNQAKVQLRLNADKQVIQKDNNGKEQVTWQALQGKVVVQPGDVIRYRVAGENPSDKVAKNLTITQPIPKQTIFVLNSNTAVPNNGVKAVYSIDNGKSFVERPTIQVKLPNGKVETRPAPAEAYTHVSWKFAEPVAPKSKINTTYQVRVR